MPQPRAASNDAAMSFADDPDFTTAPWSLDELEGSADLGSVRSAWAGSGDGLDH